MDVVVVASEDGLDPFQVIPVVIGEQGPPGPASKYGIGISFTGYPRANEVLGGHTAQGLETYNLAQSNIRCQVKATNSTTIYVNKVTGDNDTESLWLSITFTNASYFATLTFAAENYLVNGESIIFYAPPSQDPTLATVFGTLVGQ